MVRRTKATTIAEVAQHAGVSPATVSRVMNDRFLGAPEIADRVRASARQLEYSPNHLARSFALGQTNAIGFLVPDLANPSFQAVLSGLSKAAGAEGYRVLVADSAESAEDEPLLAAEIRRRCDALVLCAPRMAEDSLVHATATLGPVVLMNRSSSSVTAPTLSVDSRSGFEALARHLHGLGHRRLAYVEGPAGVANERRLQGLADFQGSVEGVTVERVAGGAGSEHGLEAVDAVIRTRATAALAFNDLVAVGLVHGLVESGIRVPDDISVTGFDDIPFARFMSPSLTTASVPHEVLGTLAWARMRALIAGTTPEHDVVFQPRLEVRRSTAAPRRA
ncbi:LacI family DNA-binding transcriptional regulator [Microbacterium cremeum]|uniref:LacI family DNA-binding transcriptional regulator n=1 Tax=Microbacterium cremeum TaxID=2782169 RepID=UPI001E500123|nr:LacI family DNA-binding transcriptional regulator [Microbacterium cremeum]